MGYEDKTKEQLICEIKRLGLERKSAVDGLRELEERYSGVIDNIGVGVALISPHMEILSLNNQMKKWFPDIDTSKNPVCYKAFNNPPRDAICSYCPTYKTLLDGQVYESVTDTPAGKESIRYRIVSSPLKDNDGNIVAAIEMVDDITEKKKLDILLQKERKTFFSILQKAPYGVVMMDRDGRYLYMNEEFTRITGYTFEDVPTGRDWFRKVYPDENYRENVIRAWKNDITRKGVLQIFTIVCKNGKKKEVEFRPYYLDEGRYIVMLSDITKQKRAERALKKAHDELERRVRERTAELESLNEKLGQHIKETETINQELRTFNYSVSHDLKTPVIAIEGLSHRLLRQYTSILDTKGQQSLAMINKSSIQMRELIDDLLAFFSLGRKNIEISSVDMDKIVREAFEQLKAIYTECEIELNIKPLSKSRADGAMVRQVVSNLLSNAIKYSKPKGKIFIEVGGRVEPEKHVYYVKDNGVGFSMDHAQKIFEVFERLHNSDEFEGTGIGLAIVKRVINRHGGEVWAEAKVNAGATFYFGTVNIIV
ncbi:MAG: ATP-binding protein [Proteobacteria bacterium]|nr:ATP-binding protein [Pseudomonadota bacterium]